MSFTAPFLLVATLVAATGVAAVTEAQAGQKAEAAQMQALHAAAARHSSVGPAVLVLAAAR